MSSNKHDTPIQPVDYLLLYSDLNEDLSLFYGQMGVIIALFEFGRIKSDLVATRSAQEMLASLLKQLDESLPYGLACGYAGIAWGVCYLQHRSFIDVDLSDILEDIDAKVKELDISRIIDPSLEAGLEGLLHYVLIRTLLQPSFLVEDAEYMNAWDSRLSQRYNSGTSTSEIERNYMTWRKCNSELSYKPQEHLSLWINARLESSSEFFECPLGIRDGIAGLLLRENDL